ncbi:MAG: DnaJ domain-containing protein [Caldilinea sp.]
MASSLHQADHYEVLGVSTLASDDEIRQRYRFLALAFHPDRYRRNSEHHHQAEQQIKRVNEAYRVLSDVQLRSAFDASRRLLGGVDPGIGRPAASVYAQSLQDMARASQRLAQVEQELLKSRDRLEKYERTNASLSDRLTELEQMRSTERGAFEVEQKALLLQVEQLTQDAHTQGRTLQEKLDHAERKIERLQQEAERKTALIDRMNAAKAAWESSSQSRLDSFNQRIERLRAELEERNRQLAEVLGGSKLLQEQVTQEQRTARHTMQTYSSALSFSETEAARLQIELDAFTATQQRNHALMRLWQVAAIIGIANTLILLVIVLQWLRGG